MIRPIDIRLNAAHPDYPLAEAVTFAGSPSTVLIRGVPPNCGRWAITAVSVAATYPDGSTTTRAAVQSANGVWVATLPATATSGRTANGLRVLANGIDENGEAVTGYVLGVADFAVASLDVTPAPQPGETSYQMLYFDEVPGTLRKGDVAKVDGVLKLYNGEAWEAFATPPTLDDAVTPTSANAVKSSGIWSAIWGALTALPTGFTSLYDWVVDRLAGKRDFTDLNYATTSLPFGIDYWTLGGSVRYSFSLSYPGWHNDTGTGVIKGTYSNGVWSFKFWGSDDTSGAPIWEWTGFETRIMGNVQCVAHTKSLALSSDVPSPSTSTPLMDGTGAAGSSAAFARGDHVHPSDSAKLDKSGGTMTGPLEMGEQQLLFGNGRYCIVQFGNGLAILDLDNAINTKIPFSPTGEGTLALTAGTGHAGNLAELDANGNPTDAGWTAGDLARYALTTKTIDNGAVSLDDRAMNAVAVSSSLASLTVSFPTATSGKARDFGLRLTVASGITTAPQIVLPQGVTCENADGEAPEIGADGAATILYFTETASGVFLVKGEVLQTITA